MAQSLTIACPSTWELGSFGGFLARIAQDEGAIFSKFDHQLQLVGKDLAWKLIVDDRVDTAAAAEEYASNDELDDRFRDQVPDLRFFSVTFNDVDVTRRMLRAVALEVIRNREDAWIDTDYGWVIHVQDFFERTEQDASWDWRRAVGDK